MTANDANPIRFAVIGLAFVIHFVAWIGFYAIRTAASNHYFGDGLITGVILLVLACFAGAGAIVVARDLSPIPRSIFFVLSIAVFGISGIDEVVSRTVSPTQDLMALTIGEMFSTIGMLIFPFVIAGAGIALLACSAVVIVAFFPLFGLYAMPWWFQPVWMISLGSAFGTVTTLFLLDRTTTTTSSRGLSAVARIFGFIVVVSGMQLCILSTAQIVAPNSLVTGGMALWPSLACGFFVAAMALLMASRLQQHRSLQP